MLRPPTFCTVKVLDEENIVQVIACRSNLLHQQANVLCFLDFLKNQKQLTRDLYCYYFLIQALRKPAILTLMSFVKRWGYFFLFIFISFL